jgi:hypothetical protein
MFFLIYSHVHFSMASCHSHSASPSSSTKQ